MSKAMINLKAVKPGSEFHNERKKEYDYVKKDLTPSNEHWKTDEVLSRNKTVNRLCKEISGRKLQKNAEPIREAVVLIKPTTTMDDLNKLSNKLKDRFGMECFQIHIHRDEGHENKEKEWIPNLHAHMVFDYQDKTTGKTLKLSRLDYSQMQTLVADELGMERGEYRENSNRERIEAVEFKALKQEEKYSLRHDELREIERNLVRNCDTLHQQRAELEQKKNEVRARIERFAEEREEPAGTEETFSEQVTNAVNNQSASLGILAGLDENSLIDAIYVLEKQIHEIEEQID